jgi:serine/threonine protein kinase
MRHEYQQLASQLSTHRGDGSAQPAKEPELTIHPTNSLDKHQRDASDSKMTSPQDTGRSNEDGTMDVVKQQGYTTETDSVYHSIREALAERCGWQIGSNKFLWNEEVPVTEVTITGRGFLGKGMVGIVDEVAMNGSHKPIARKRFVLQRGKQSAARDRKDIRAEIETLKGLYHPHIVKILGCYEEQWGQAPSICALMHPAADEDLSHFLYEQCQPASDEQRGWIDTWFRCLASALAYMHSQHVHHEDIKPSNIVHRGQKIYFTDFGSSRRLEAGQDTSTESPARASRLFAAPEAMSEDGKIARHGSKTDVYSLGLVFVEMLAVFSQKNVSEMRDFLFKDETFGTKRYCQVVDKIPAFLGPSCLKDWDYYLGRMLHPLRTSRPSARGVIDMLQSRRDLGISNTSCPCNKSRTVDPVDDQAPFLLSREETLKPILYDPNSHNRTLRPRGVKLRKGTYTHFDTLMSKNATDSRSAEDTKDHESKSPEALDDDFVWVA